MEPDKQEFTLEEGLVELERIAKAIESGQEPMERSIELFDRAAHIYKTCKATLGNMQLKLEKIQREVNE